MGVGGCTVVQGGGVTKSGAMGARPTSRFAGGGGGRERGWE